MNKNISDVRVEIYHGVNRKSLSFCLNGVKYWAKKEWDEKGKVIECVYGLMGDIYYYDTIDTLAGDSRGMEQLPVDLTIGKMPEELFDEISRS